MKFAMAFGLVLLVVAAGCRNGTSTDYGTGLNTVDRKYAKSADEVWNAAVDSAKSSGFAIGTQNHDALGGEVVAQRGTGEKVTIKVRSLAKTSTEASVRVEPGDRALANQLHEMMAKKLGMSEATGGPFGGVSLDATYDITMKRSMGVSDRVFQGLKVTETARTMGEKDSEIKGRTDDSTPVRISMTRIEDQKTRVTFYAGSSKSDAHRTLAESMKRDFDREALNKAE